MHARARGAAGAQSVNVCVLCVCVCCAKYCVCVCVCVCCAAGGSDQSCEGLIARARAALCAQGAVQKQGWIGVARRRQKSVGVQMCCAAASAASQSPEVEAVSAAPQGAWGGRQLKKTKAPTQPAFGMGEGAGALKWFHTHAPKQRSRRRLGAERRAGRRGQMRMIDDDHHFFLGGGGSGPP